FCRRRHFYLACDKNKIEESIMSVSVTGGALALLAVCLLTACGGGSSSSNPSPSVDLRVVSSEPQWVSGGDARVAVRGDAELLADARLRLNGDDLDRAGFDVGADGVEGVIEGLENGDNRLEVWHPDHGSLASLTLTNYPIEGPMF